MKCVLVMACSLLCLSAYAQTQDSGIRNSTCGYMLPKKKR